MKNLLKEKKAITLIALVITIVVMLILAIVTINLTLGDNGIFKRAKLAKEQYQNAESQEQIDIAKATNEIDSHVGNTRDENKYIFLNNNVKYILERIGKKYEITIADLIKNDEIFNEMLNNVDVLRNAEIFNQIISNKKIIENNSYIGKLKTFAEENLTTTTVPQLSSNGNSFGTATPHGPSYDIWKAFDGDNVSNYAFGGNGNFYIGYQFSEDIWVYKFSIIQRKTGNSEGVDNIKLMYSDDGVNYTEASNTYTTQHTEDLEQYFDANKSVGKHKYWKITGNGYGWNGGVGKLQFYGIK